MSENERSLSGLPGAALIGALVGTGVAVVGVDAVVVVSDDASAAALG